MGLLFLQYFGLSFLVVFSSIRISECVDELDKKTNLGGALIGGILLAGVTSLPELITSLSSTLMLSNPDLALGNILGSNAFNVFILALGNLIFIKHMMFNHTTKINAKTNFINVIIYILILFTFFSVTNIRVAHVGVTSVFIFMLYYLNLKVASLDEEDQANHKKDTSGKIGLLIVRFIFWGVIIVGASMLVSITTNKIAQATGIGSSFIGAIFLGVATSLPETTSLMSLVRLRNYDMAVGNIVGSNLFNFGVIALTDFLYFSGNIFEIADTSNSLLVTVGLCEAIILLFILLRRRITNKFVYALPSFLILLIYSYYIALSLK